MTLGGAAQVAAAHCPNERTLEPAVCSQTDPTMPQPAALWPSPRNVLGQIYSLFLVASITRYQNRLFERVSNPGPNLRNILRVILRLT